MKKILPLLGLVIMTSAAVAQDSPIPEKKKKETIDLSNRSNDHFMVQFGLAGWSGIPDTINKSGFSKSFNVYFLFDFPFKNNPKLSFAFGPGIASDHILFGSTRVGIKDPTSQIHFTNASDTNHYKKTKLAMTYLEAPIEFRYSTDPLRGKGFKVAVGLKVGTMINAHTRNTKYQDKNGSSLTDHTLKESSKQFFNKNRISFMGRVGYGHFSLFGSYQLTPLFADGKGPLVKPFSIGLTLSGL
ncbi:MAG: outer membrane beta-barrel protein [Chitinophagaceae bacterium]